MQLQILILLLFSVLLNIGCQRQSQPSYLIVTVDDLASTDVLCTSDRFADNPKSGFSTLCQESIRFTHAYTPSTMAVPAISSLLTGLYPIDHGTRHNGDTLSPTYLTAAEAALTKGYRTSFFSGGAPVLRKSGLNQGFEIFDDEIQPDPLLVFRPSEKTIRKFVDWAQGSSRPFFSFLYLPDLTFTNIQTTNQEGDIRNFSFDSQLDEVDENLESLFTYLKKEGLWDNTNIVVMGLTGHSQSERPLEPGPINLHSENTQVALFVKPAGPKRDLALTWKIDRNVTLVDIGHTLRSQLEVKEPSTSSFPLITLKPTLKDLETSIPQDRPLLIESSWPSWRYQIPPRYAFIKDKYIWIYDSQPKIYNTLIDHFENNSLSLNISLIEEFQDTLELIRGKSILPFPGLPKEELAKMRIHYSNWMRSDKQESLINELESLYRELPTDTEPLHWYLRALMEKEKVFDLLKATKDSKLNAWSFINDLSETVNPQDTCLALLLKKLSPSDLKSCPDEMWVEFLSWIQAENLGLSREVQRNRFERKLWHHKIDQSIAKYWLASNRTWDLNLNIRWHPTRTEMSLLMPRWHRQKIMVENSFRFYMENKNTQF